MYFNLLSVHQTPSLSVCQMDGSVGSMRVLVTGGSGLVGRAIEREREWERGGQRERREKHGIPVIQRDQSCVRNTHQTSHIQHNH